MKFHITRASCYGEDNNPPVEKSYQENGNWFINIDSIDQLIEIIDKEHKIILNKKQFIECKDKIVYGIGITIYDDYIE